MTDRSRQRREINRYLHEQEAEGLTTRYQSQTRSTLCSFRVHCEDLGVNSTKSVDRECVWTYLRRFEGLSYSHQRTTASILRVYLTAHGNTCMHRMKLRFGGYGRVRVDWLTPEETEQVFRTPMTPREMLLIGAGLLQGMRRIEVLRMTVRDAKEALQAQNLRIRGKGHKERSMPLHDDFSIILRSFLVWADRGSDSELLLGVKRTTSEKILGQFCSRFGRRFTFHTLRRTFGRNIWLVGVPLETISELLGHSSVDMTRLYLGLNMTDMRKALSAYRVSMNASIPIKPA